MVSLCRDHCSTAFLPNLPAAVFLFCKAGMYLSKRPALITKRQHTGLLHTEDTYITPFFTYSGHIPQSGLLFGSFFLSLYVHFFGSFALIFVLHLHVFHHFFIFRFVKPPKNFLSPSSPSVL